MQSAAADTSSTDAAINVGARVRCTEAEGPGRRYALWVRGCPIRCPGCCNPHLFERDPSSDVPVGEVLEEIAGAAGVEDDLEGVTLLGGEPFEQAESLALLAQGVRRLGLSVMVFTGYRRERLRREGRDDWDALLAATDLLVDGPYVEALHQTDRRWIGSSNQRVHFLSERYDHLRDEWDEGANTVELRLVDGELQINGFPHPSLTRLSADSAGEAE